MSDIDTEIENKYADWLFSRAIPNGECLECHLNQNAVKYPKIADNEMAHRYVFRVKKGSVGGKLVMHTCDNPRCINLDHLVLGTYDDNNRDCREKGRAVLTGRPKILSNEERERIIEAREKGVSVQEIAQKYFVSARLIYRVLAGES